MSATGAGALQTGLVTMCKAISFAQTTPVYDYVPEDAGFPRIVVGKIEESDASYFGQTAHDCYPTIEVWDKDGETVASNASVAGFKRGEAVAELIIAALRNDQLAVSGHDVVSVDPGNSMQADPEAGDDPSIRVVRLTPHILLEDS